MTTVKITLIITLIILAVINDLYNFKVRNELTFGFAAIGIAYNLMFYGWQSFGFAVLGLAVPFILLLPLYMTKMLGAGDIKLFCTLGAFVGVKMILGSIAYSFIAGAVIALIIMAARRNALARLKHFFAYIKCCFLCMAILPYCDINSRYDGTKMHFTIPIALGTMAVLLLNQNIGIGGNI